MTATETEYQQIALADLFESPHNPRRIFHEKDMAELIANVKAHGQVFVPLMVRRNMHLRKDGGLYEILGGARRYRAATAAGLSTVPVRVLDVSDTEALEMMIIDNQRTDPHPLEEAEGFRQLLACEGYTIELLAEKTGRDESYIYKRLQLAKLIEPLKGKFLNAEIQLGHAILLARLSEKDQIMVAKEGLFEEEWDHGSNKRYLRVLGVAELDRWIRSEVYLDLKAAPWDKTDAKLIPKAGACNVCPKRSGANAQLFDDFPKGDVCLDSACFASKREAHLVQIEKKAVDSGEKLIRVATEYLNPSDEKKLKAMGTNGYSKVEGKKKCQHAEKALVVAGRQDVGKIIEVCREKSCKVHHPYGSGAGSRTTGVDWAQRKKNLDLKIRVQTRREWWLGLLEVAPAKLGRAELDIVMAEMISRCHHTRRMAICAAMGLQPKKTKTKWNSMTTDHEGAIKAHVASLSDGLLMAFMVAFCFTGDLETQPYNTPTDALKKAASGYGVNVDLIARQVSAPLLAKFEKTKKNAQAKAAAEKKAGKAAPAKKGKKASVSDEEPLDDEGDDA